MPTTIDEYPFRYFAVPTQILKKRRQFFRILMNPRPRSKRKRVLTDSILLSRFLLPSTPSLGRANFPPLHLPPIRNCTRNFSFRGVKDFRIDIVVTARRYVSKEFHRDLRRSWLGSRKKMVYVVLGEKSFVTVAVPPDEMDLLLSPTHVLGTFHVQSYLETVQISDLRRAFVVRWVVSVSPWTYGLNREWRIEWRLNLVHVIWRVIDPIRLRRWSHPKLALLDLVVETIHVTDIIENCWWEIDCNNEVSDLLVLLNDPISVESNRRWDLLGWKRENSRELSKWVRGRVRDRSEIVVSVGYSVALSVGAQVGKEWERREERSEAVPTTMIKKRGQFHNSLLHCDRLAVLYRL